MHHGELFANSVPGIKTRNASPEHIIISRSKSYWSSEHEKIAAANFLALNMGCKAF